MRPPKWYESLALGIAFTIGLGFYVSRDQANIHLDPPVANIFGMEEWRPKDGHCLDLRFNDKDGIVSEKLYLNGERIGLSFLERGEGERPWRNSLRRMFLMNSEMEKGRNEVKYEAVDVDGDVTSDIVYIDN